MWLINSLGKSEEKKKEKTQKVTDRRSEIYVMNIEWVGGGTSGEHTHTHSLHHTKSDDVTTADPCNSNPCISCSASSPTPSCHNPSDTGRLASKFSPSLTNYFFGTILFIFLLPPVILLSINYKFKT